LSDEEAKAVTASAQAAGKAIDAVRAVGAFIQNTVGSVPENLVGLAGGDWVHEQRRRNAARMRAKTEQILAAIDRNRLSEPSVSVVLPLLQASADEAREELQALWAALMANSMVDGGRLVRRDYFETLRRMEPQDAVTLDIMNRVPRDRLVAVPFMTSERNVKGLAGENWDISISALVELRCLSQFSVLHGYSPISAYGKGLLLACSPP